MEVNHLNFSLQMCIERQLVLGPRVCRASDEQSRLNHPRGTEAAYFLHTSHPELSPHFLQLLLEPTSSWAARAKLQSTLSPVWPQGIGLGESPSLCWLPWTTSPSLKVLDPGPTPFSLRPLPLLPLHTPAGAPPPPLATSPSELLVIGLGLTPSPCQPIRVVFMFPPFTQRMHMKSLKSELGIFS